MLSLWTGKNGPLLIAEIGGNHEGDFNYAIELTSQAIESGADVIKYQIYTADSIVNKKISPDRHKHFSRFELTPDQHITLAKMCEDGGVDYMASVWDVEAFDWIDEFVGIYKVGSGDLTAYPLINRMALTGKPLILSTGLANFYEISDCVDYCRSVNEAYKGADKLAVLQCTSMYPIKNTDANLNVMSALKAILQLPIGYSDHTEGLAALKYAYCMGAEVLEFHFTDSRDGKEFRDHKVSLTKSEVRELISEIKLINDLRGTPLKRPEKIEVENGHVHSFRRAIFPKKRLLAGHVIRAEDLVCLRPNSGIDARDYSKVVGRTLSRDVEELEVLDFKMFEAR